MLALNFIKEDLRTDKMFPGGSDTTEKIRDAFTFVLWECKRQGGQKHVTETFISKIRGRAVLEEEGRKLVSSFRGNHKACMLHHHLHRRWK